MIKVPLPSLTKGIKVVSYNISIDQHNTLICIEDDSISENEKRTFQWIIDGHMMRSRTL